MVIRCILLLWGVSAALLAQTASQHLDAGIELSRNGKFTEAADRFVRALELDPTLHEAHYLLSLVRQERGDREGAIRSLREAIRLAPDLLQRVRRSRPL